MQVFESLILHRLRMAVPKACGIPCGRFHFNDRGLQQAVVFVDVFESSISVALNRIAFSDLAQDALVFAWSR